MGADFDRQIQLFDEIADEVKDAYFNIPKNKIEDIMERVGQKNLFKDIKEQQKQVYNTIKSADKMFTVKDKYKTMFEKLRDTSTYTSNRSKSKGFNQKIFDDINEAIIGAMQVDEGSIEILKSLPHMPMFTIDLLHGWGKLRDIYETEYQYNEDLDWTLVYDGKTADALTPEEAEIRRKIE